MNKLTQKIFRALFLAFSFGMSTLSLSLQAAADDAVGSKPVPSDRQQILDALEKLKQRTPRIPLPTEAKEAAPPASGALGVVNNGLMRNYYLPAELRSGGFSRQTDPAMKLDNVFSTELFWIVSRVNNCHYCLGHQEAKLKTAGVLEQQLLELDTDWKLFPADRQAAFAFARKLTLAPHAISDEDIEGLRSHFADAQILEIAFLVGRYNSTNRWTDSLGIPQEDHRDFKSELSTASLKTPSAVAVHGFPARPIIDEMATWEAAYQKASQRVSRLPLENSIKDFHQTPANYERLLATFPVQGRQWIDQIRSARTVGSLPADLKEKIAYVAARADNAWYMQHRARSALLKRGLSDKEIFHLTNSADNKPDSTVLKFVFKLTANPQTISDADVAELLKSYSPAQVAEIVYHVGVAAFLDRVSETAGLGWKDEPADS